jgi:mitogen-activated protein kinase
MFNKEFKAQKFYNSKPLVYGQRDSEHNRTTDCNTPDIYGTVGDNRTTYEHANFLVNSRYKIEHVLGKGSYGTVCSAIDTKSKDKPSIAIKKVCNIFNKEVLLKRAIRELKLMEFFKGHKNIIGLIDIDIVYIKPYDGLYCIQELIDYDLAKVIHSSVQFTEFHIKSFFYQICCGVKYIHSANVIHRDLKPGNILVSSQGCLKICDFGLARGISEKYMRNNHKSNNITNYVATRWYRAPELILTRKKYGKPIDIWAVGCIFAELYGRRPIFMADDQIQQINEICKIIGTPSKEIIFGYGSSIAWELFTDTKPKYHKKNWDELYSHANKEAQNLLDKLLCWEAISRYNIDQILDHPYLENIRNKDEEVNCDSCFDFSYEWKTTNLRDMKMLLHEEVESFKAKKRTINNKYDNLDL